MTLEEIVSAEIPSDKLAQLTKEELIVLLRGEQSFRRQLQKCLKTAEELNELLRQKTVCSKSSTSRSRAMSMTRARSVPPLVTLT